jgi:hypothetical protein
MTLEDRDFSWVPIQATLRSRQEQIRAEQSNPPTQPPQTPEPVSFLDYITEHHENNTRDLGQNPPSPEEDILNDASLYMAYLQADPAFGRGPLERFESLFYGARRNDALTFDFVPDLNPEHLVLTFREWFDSHPELRDSLLGVGDVQFVVIWLRAIGGYGGYLKYGQAASWEHRGAFAESRRLVVENDRPRLNELSPQDPRTANPPGASEAGEDSAKPFLTFLQWAVEQYSDDSARDVGQTPEEALEDDMNEYELYVEQNGTQEQLNLFRSLRATVDDNTYDFVPSSGDTPSFFTWTQTENE